MTLHVTNGDNAVDALRRAGVPGEILPWRDVLHEGPVPSGLSSESLREVRARFIADCGWGAYGEVLAQLAERDAALDRAPEHDEVVLWFEHDLYDQLQLLQVLDRLAAQRSDLWTSGAPKVSMIVTDSYLGTAELSTVAALAVARRPVEQVHLSLARDAWTAFRHPDPTAVVAMLNRGTSALPFLAAALRRELEELPWTTTGLSRSELQALQALASGHTRLVDAFRAAQGEPALFLGDSVFAMYLERLGHGPTPLVTFDDGSTLIAPQAPGAREAFWTRCARLTDDARAVLDRHVDALTKLRIDRWLGGVHLQGGTALWRWDALAERPVRAA